MKSLKYQIQRNVQQLLILLRKIELPGFQGVGLYDVLRFFFGALLDGKFTLMASAMAYQFFFSLFPILLLAYLILPLFPIDGLIDQVLAFITQFVPNPEQSLSTVNLEERLNAFSQRSPNIWLLILSIGLILWGSTRGIIAMMKAFTKQEEVFRKRTIWQLYGEALLILLILGVIIVCSVLFQLLGDRMLRSLEILDWINGATVFWLSRTLNFFLTFIATFLSIAILYYLAPATHQRWKFVSPGVIAAGVLIMAAMIGLKYYFRNFADFDWIYGSLGAIILLMVWFYYISIMLLIGFELNAAIDIASFKRGRLRIPGVDSEESIDSPTKKTEQTHEVDLPG